MTRVALIADVHANAHALRAVLDDADAQGADAVFDLGDVVGYGPSPNETIEIFRSRGILSVAGNHDRKVCGFGRHRAEYAATKHGMAYRTFQWTYDTLAEDNLEYLANLPARRLVRIGGVEFDLTHVLSEVAAQPLPDWTCDHVFAWGHAHVPAIERTGRAVVINAGTVGRGRRGDVRASYVLVDADAGRVSASTRWVAYDLRATLQAIVAVGLPDAFSEMFRQGRLLRQVAAAIITQD